MADELRIRYTGTAGAYADQGKTFLKGGDGVPVSDEQAEKLLALEGEHSFEEISEEEYEAVERAAEAEKAAQEGADEIEGENETEAERRGAYYGAQSQDEIDEIFHPTDEAEQVEDEEPEGGDASPDAESEAGKVKLSFAPPKPEPEPDSSKS